VDNFFFLCRRLLASASSAELARGQTGEAPGALEWLISVQLTNLLCELLIGVPCRYQFRGQMNRIASLAAGIGHSNRSKSSVVNFHFPSVSPLQLCTVVVTVGPGRAGLRVVARWPVGLWLCRFDGSDGSPTKWVQGKWRMQTLHSDLLGTTTTAAGQGRCPFGHSLSL